MRKDLMDSDAVKAALLGAGVLASDVPVEGGTAFSRLTKEARSAIVGAVLGRPNPPLSDEVRQEIKEWAELDEGADGDHEK